MRLAIRGDVGRPEESNGAMVLAEAWTAGARERALVRRRAARGASSFARRWNLSVQQGAHAAVVAIRKTELGVAPEDVNRVFERPFPLGSQELAREAERVAERRERVDEALGQNDLPRQVVLTKGFVYALTPLGDALRLPRELLRTKRKGSLEDTIYVFGRNTELRLPNRDDCRVRPLLDAQVPSSSE